MSEPKNLDVTIMGHEFRVACPADEEPALLRSVAYLDSKMREIRAAGKLAGVERIAIMAALNVTHSYLSGTGGGDGKVYESRAQVLVDEIDRALGAS